MRAGSRHRASRWKFVAPGGAAAVTVALVWSAMGMPGWAEEAPKPAARAAAESSVGAVACDDGKDGDGKGRYQAVYVTRQGGEPAAKPDGPGAVRQVLWDIDQTFEASAKRYAAHNESRRPRFVQDENCRPDVMNVEVSGIGETHTMSEVRDLSMKAVDAKAGSTEEEREEWKSTHRMLFFYDTGKPDGCGTAGAPGPESRADMHGGWAEVSWGCSGEAAMTHEMIHQFGVTHCDEDKSQGADPICRGYDETPRCDGPRAAAVLDCGLDEFRYFDPRPSKGSYLSKHPKENVARSPYLIDDQPAEPVAARLADQESGKCLTADGKGKSLRLGACDGDGRQWVRSIDRRGHHELKLDGKCLAKGKGGVPELTTCVANDARQDWWTTANNGETKDGYQIVHRHGGDPVTVDGASVFVMKSA